MPYEDHIERVVEAFDPSALKRICEEPEEWFPLHHDMEIVDVNGYYPDDWYAFKDNGSDILAVAHLDTVVTDRNRTCAFVYDTENGWVVRSGALDDRLGAYTILDLLPRMGLAFDVLLTTGEESGCSTAQYFDPSEHHDREYNWIIEFDRGGTDVVMYEYEDKENRRLVQEAGATVGVGIFTDICYLEHVGVKGFNWGVGYRDYHSVNGHAYLADYITMIAQFLEFHEANAKTMMPHEESPYGSWWGDYRGSRASSYSPFYDDRGGSMLKCELCDHYSVNPDTEHCDVCEWCNACWVSLDDGYCLCEWSLAQRREDEEEDAAREVADVIGDIGEWRDEQDAYAQARADYLETEAEYLAAVEEEVEAS